MGLFNIEITVAENLKNNKMKDVKIKSPKGYGAIKENLGENNLFTVRRPALRQ